MDTVIAVSNTISNSSLNDLFKWFVDLDYAGISSFLGFLLSLYVAKNVYRVNKYIFIMKRLPQYQQGFESYASSIIHSLSDFRNNEEEIIDIIAKCKSNTKMIKKKVPRVLKNEVKNLNKRIDNVLKKENKTEQDIRNIYRNILSVIQSIDNFQKDYQMER